MGVLESTISTKALILNHVTLVGSAGGTPHDVAGVLRVLRHRRARTSDHRHHLRRDPRRPRAAATRRGHGTSGRQDLRLAQLDGAHLGACSGRALAGCRGDEPQLQPQGAEHDPRLVEPVVALGVLDRCQAVEQHAPRDLLLGARQVGAGAHAWPGGERKVARRPCASRSRSNGWANSSSSTLAAPKRRCSSEPAGTSIPSELLVPCGGAGRQPVRGRAQPQRLLDEAFSLVRSWRSRSNNPGCSHSSCACSSIAYWVVSRPPMTIAWTMPAISRSVSRRPSGW